MSILYRFRDIARFCRNSLTLTHPTFAWRPRWGDLGWISRRSLASESQIPWANVRRCLCNPKFSRFSRTPTCYRQTDRQTQTDRASIASSDNQRYRPTYSKVRDTHQGHRKLLTQIRVIVGLCIINCSVIKYMAYCNSVNYIAASSKIKITKTGL